MILVSPLLDTKQQLIVLQHKGLHERLVATSEAGAHVVFCGIVRDITGRRRAESALRDSEVRYHALYHMNTASAARRGGFLARVRREMERF